MLTDIKIKSLKPKEKNYKVGDGKGLYILVHKNGSKYWRLKYRFNGKEKTYSIGVYPEVKLSEARFKTDSARLLIANGTDPSEAKKVKSAKANGLNTFRSMALEWHNKMSTEWKPSHSKEVLHSLEQNVFPYMGDLDVDDISPQTVLKVIKTIELRGALEIVQKTRQRCDAIFRYAIILGKASYNPAADLRGAFQNKKVRHFNALEKKDLPQFLQKLETYKGEITTIIGLKLAILTFARTNEIRFASWDEIDFDNKQWVIKAERMKMGRDHIVPLSKQALKLLYEIKQITGEYKYVFASYHKPNKQPISENAMLFALYRMGYKGKATVHGFRATASTILNEEGFSPDWIEKQLAHEQSNKVRAAYNRAEYLSQRTEMMQTWADTLDQLMK